MNITPETLNRPETIGVLRQSIDAADRVMVQPRFGTSEDWVYVTKKEARELMGNYADTDTLADLGFGTTALGEIRGGVLYMG